MATQDERLTQLETNHEHFKIETIQTYQDLAMRVTIQKGLLDNVIGRLADVKVTLNEHTQRLDSIDTRLDSMDIRLDSMDTRLGSFEQSMNYRFDTQDKKLDQMFQLLTKLVPRSGQENQ